MPTGAAPRQPAEQRFSASTLAALAPTETPAAVLAPADAVPAAPQLAMLSNPIGPAAPPLTTGTPSPDTNLAATGPDLARMVETIARARAEVQQVAASGGSVHVALRHVEFGAVSVRFEHDRGDLAVNLSSPDPDFSRAVAAVAASQPAAAANDAMTSRDGPARPSDGQAFSSQAGSQGPSQQRGQGDAPSRQPLFSHQPGRRSEPTASDSNPEGEGIFA